MRQHKRPFYIGCATDAKFVEYTAVMLTSLAVNGCVREATILVAAFGLSASDRISIRIGAGRGRRVRFVDVTEAMLQGVGEGTLERYPPAALGRLVLADTIKERNARLLTLDSDMIVNTSVQPLLSLDLGDDFFAAVHDPPRTDDPTYFNSGLTLTDVDMYRHWDIGRRSILYCAEHRPWFADQDALNAIIGHQWYKLDPLWNFFVAPGRDTTPEDYEAAKIAHFPSWKPWDDDRHPGYRLYWRYHAQYRQLVDNERRGLWPRAKRSVMRGGRLRRRPQTERPLGTVLTTTGQAAPVSPPRQAREGATASGLARDLIASSYEVLLGRSLENDEIISQRGSWPRDQIIRSIVTSAEFAENALRWANEGVAPSGVFDGSPTIRQRYWAADNLPLGKASITAVEDAVSWRNLLAAILSDSVFRETYGLADA